jgi:predicted integral membrane protein DUF2275
MNCPEVQVDLSGYLEKSLDALRMKSIELHLLACPLCREEADGIVDCIDQIHQLPMVDPPPGFARRIMAQVREMEVEPTLWQRIFGPLKLGMPIQTAAVVVIAVLAVFVYQNQLRIKNAERGESSTPTHQFTPEEKANSISDSNQPSGRAQPSAKETKRDLRADTTIAPPAAEARRKTVVESDLSKDQAPPSPAPTARTENLPTELRDAPRRPPIQAQEVATGRENFRASSDPFDIGALGSSSRSVIFAPESLLSPITEPNADFEFIVRRRVSERADQTDKVTGNTPASGSLQRQRTEADAALSPATAKRAGSVAAAPPAASITEIRWFRVPTERYDQFRKELAAEAVIESEKTGGMANELATKSNRELLIKVIIIGPGER